MRFEDLDAQAHAMILMYLAAHGAPRTKQPTHEEVGVDGVIRVVDRCSNVRGYGQYVWAPGIPLSLDENGWREVFGLVGSIGESLMVAAACEIEVEWHRRARSHGDLPQGMLIGQRFFSIAESQEILGVGHRLINVIARALAANRDVRGTIAKERNLRRWEAAYEPFSDEREAWLSANAWATKQLACVAAQHSHPSYGQLVDSVHRVVERAEWRELDACRGQDFHRWRAESSVMAGIDKASGYLRPIVSRDGAVSGHSLTVDPVRYSAADGLEEKEARVAHAALLAVADAVTAALDALDVAIEPLTGGRLRINDKGLRQTIGGRWDEAQCRCCRAGKSQRTDRTVARCDRK